MRQLKTIAFLAVLSLMASHGNGQSLFEEGRKAYIETGNKAQLKRIIDSIDVNDQNQIEYHKLCGDFHYLNSDEDYRSYDSAASHFKIALSFAESPSNETDQNAFYYQFVLHLELAQLYYKQNRYQEAYEEMKQAEKRANYDNDNDILDFISQFALCKARVKKFQEAIDDINMVIGRYPNKNDERYGEALRKKAKILMLQQENESTGMAEPSEEAMKCYKEYFALKKKDALEHLGNMSPEDREHYWMRIRPFVVDCYRTEGADPAFLYDVTLFSKSLLLEYAQRGKPQLFTWKQVQQQLKPTDCAVEFIEYEKFNERQMGALVLKQKGQPQFVWIGNLVDIEDAKLAWGDYLVDAVSLDESDLKDELYTDSTIFSRIWTPDLLKAIGKDTQRLYFATDGLFHKLAIEYMLPEAPELTSLKTENLYRLSSTRQLLTKSNTRSSKTRTDRILLSGGINYYGTPQTGSDNEMDYANDEQAYRILKSRRTYFNLLDGTIDEIEGIRSYVGDDKVTLLTDTLATETRVASLIKEHPIIHLATHGFYFGITPEGTDLKPASYDESLSQSGLAFAGSTAALLSDEFNSAQYDGILSSREIAKMDFSNVDVIVLSACQTALGYLTSDGIYGLQRSLKNAGVKAMIVSLWSVDDDATSTLMQAFYKHLQNEDTHTAFYHAREELINSNREPTSRFNPKLMINETTGKDFNNPYFYNAFIMIDIK